MRCTQCCSPLREVRLGRCCVEVPSRSVLRDKFWTSFLHDLVFQTVLWLMPVRQFRNTSPVPHANLKMSKVLCKLDTYLNLLEQKKVRRTGLGDRHGVVTLFWRAPPIWRTWRHVTVSIRSNRPKPPRTPHEVYCTTYFYLSLRFRALTIRIRVKHWK